MNNQNKETAIQNEQQLNDNSSIIEEFQELNHTPKDIINVLWYISWIKMLN